MSWFSLLSVLSWAILVGLAYVRGGRFASTFFATIIGFHTLSSTALYANADSWLTVLWPYFQASVYLHFLFWLWPSLRPGWHRALISIPGSWFAASTFLAIPWAIIGALGVTLYAEWLPYVLGLIGVFQSLRTNPKNAHITIDDVEYPELQPVHHETSIKFTETQTSNLNPNERPLKIVQITDPHLGPFMSVERLQKICQDAVDAKPDLILLTGDYLTVESQYDSSYLTKALSPLRELPGRVFACRGNHDLEAPEIIDEALEKNGIRLLNDEATLVQTEAGAVQILGSDFHWRERAAKLMALCRRYPRVMNATRIVLLHDPGAFAHIPDGEADMVFSGHTHGGQVGLVSLGKPWTFVRAATPIPDHGLWAKGKNRLYVHRGTGFYGFPLRLGVPAEEGAIYLYRSPQV